MKMYVPKNTAVTKNMAMRIMQRPMEPLQGEFECQTPHSSSQCHVLQWAMLVCKERSLDFQGLGLFAALLRLC